MNPLFAISISQLQTYAPMIVGGGVGFVVLTILAARFARNQNRYSRFNASPQSPVQSADLWEPPEGSAADRRTTVRREGVPVPILVTSGSFREKVIEGFVIDRSTGGVKISLDRAVPVSSTMQIRTENAPDNVPWLTVIIRNCRKNGDYYDLGCEFERTPPWNVLLLFG